ncbi:sugar ABC transporter substrate-binding protein [Bifidobacterium sp. MA2]|uniref:Sugar ABC transporter substrate-binding protein n=1 Tax=Bifidobacterium santillanense TaxID=2809028 RepID=A0ABS5UNC6_9BIFI|nr:sugar ABC transporter substrate-binding protein [Bifidobacterium santillanense]MBT1172384.1 sugar ABC transporter substrate-binding protein [Bifidobacterium santillanense]
MTFGRFPRWRSHLSAAVTGAVTRAVASVAALAAVVSLASCGQAADTRTHITVWSWEPNMAEVVEDFEQDNPDVVVDLKTISGYENLNTAIQDGYGMPDVAQIEYFALLQYAVSGQLLDISDYVGSDYSSFYSPGTWSSVQLAGRVYGLPMDSGPMAFFYNKDVFDQVGVDATRIKTWDDYYQAAKKLKEIGVYIAADSGDASFYAAMIWLAGGQPFHTSPDGKTVTIALDSDEGTKEFTRFWQKMLDEGLIDTRRTTWSNGWKRALSNGTIASVFSGAWMPSMLMANALGSAGLWRVAPMPTTDGRTTNAENGGSAMAVLQSTRKPRAAYRFVDYVTHNRTGIDTRVNGGAFPADLETLSSEAFLDKTTIHNTNGVDIPYFGGQQFNRVLAEAAENVSVGYQYLPFEVYARSDFRNTVGKAYKWEGSWQSYLRRQRQIRAGMTDEEGNPLKPRTRPTPKVSLKEGIASWQADLREYGANQGFTIQ